MSSLWSVASPLISSRTQFLAASKVFEVITQATLDLFKTEEGGRWSNSGKTWRSGTERLHYIVPSTLIPCSRNILGQNEYGPAEGETPIKLLTALKELLCIGMGLVKSEVISMEELINLVDCASPKVTDSHAWCSKEACVVMRQPGSLNSIALTDRLMADVLEHAKEKLGLPAIVLAKHLLNSKQWGLEFLGPLSTKRVQEFLL